MDAMDRADGGETLSLLQMIVLARWIHFGAVFVLFGSALFWTCVGNGRRLPGARGATVLLLRVAASLAALSGLAWLAGIVASMTNGLASVFDSEMLGLFFTQTEFGPVSILRLGLLAGAVLVAVSPSTKSWFFAAFGLIGALLLIDQAWLGHAAEGGAGLYGATMIAVYAVHVLAAGAWVGGLPPLLFALAEPGPRSADDARINALAILSPYSAMAMVAVGLIVVSGAANAGFRVGFDFDRLLDTDYGVVLALKAAVVAAMLALACFNRFVAMPRLREGSASLARLRASVAVELALGLAVLAVAAVLGVTPPPR
jgi:putative copper resistance protein D